MACLLTQGFTTDCLEGAGGVKEVFFSNWDNFDSGITFDVTTGEIDALPTATLYRYVPLKASASFTDASQPSQENGTIFFQQTVTRRSGGLSAAKRKEFNLLSRAKVIMFVRTMDDQIFCAGRQTGGFLSAGQAATGQARGDFNGYEFTFTADEPLPAEKCEAYTTVPFDNFADITISPPYSGAS